jgi:Phosphomannomutase
MRRKYMDSYEKYLHWLEDSHFDAGTRAELEKIKDDKAEIEERFYRELEFGTGGLRGIIGAGTNRMNIYTVGKASQGLANYVLKKGGSKAGDGLDSTSSPKAEKGNGYAEKGIVIAYDCRRMSPEFALAAALVFAGNGIKAYLFDELRPTPELSFAVRFLGAAAGIVVTASHNPKTYNGYKVYGEDGAQMSLEDSDQVLAEINSIESYTDVKTMNKQEALDKGLLNMIGARIDDEYIERLKTVAVNPGIAKSRR